MIIDELLTEFIAAEKLPNSYADTVREWYGPLCKRIANKVQMHRDGAKGLYILGVNGAQGSGKSTLSSLLVKVLNEVYALNSVCMSLDDFYYTKDERQNLAESIHPLFATRGVPGTHDIHFLSQVLDTLNKAETCIIPRFDKAVDDRARIDEWEKIDAKMDVVILEGWCVGAPAQAQSELITPVNAFEKDYDSDGVWRTYANQKLATEYQDIFAKLHAIVMLKAPSFEQIYAWRCEQEHKLRDKQTEAGNVNVGMSDEDILHFIQHYERITQHSLQYLPERCDEVFSLDNNRKVSACKSR